jgi:serine/threonine protein kinase
MARAVSRKKGNRRVIRRAPLKKRVAKKRVQRKPRKVVHRKRAQPRRKIVQKRRKTRIAKRKVRKEPTRKRPSKRVIHRKRTAIKTPNVFPPAGPSIRVPPAGPSIRVPPAGSSIRVPPAGSSIRVPPAGPSIRVPPAGSVPKGKKEIVNLVLEEIRNNGGRDVMNRFKDPNGNMGLNNIALRPTVSASGTYIGPAQVVYGNEVVNVFIKMFIVEDLREDSAPSFALLTEACISNEISQDKYPNIPTLMNSYGVLYSTQLVNDFYGNIDFNLPTHQNVVNPHGHPVYLINEMSDELGSPTVTLNDFIGRVREANARQNDYVRNLFFMGRGLNTLRKDIYSVFVQILMTLKLMHEAGLYHNDIHGGNIFVVQLAQPTYLTIGNITMFTNYVIRVYDWDRSFSTQCNPLTVNKMMYADLCQSSREPANVDMDVCYQPHEDIAWGDFWLVMYTFILGNNWFGAPDINNINSRARELINLLTNMNYTGNFWSYNHGIDLDQLIANLKPEHLDQIRS